ncbi:MAG: ethanolamine utilization protein EutQ [Clostridia bacterium]|nr:ethanolamine utilization protein EutQ [Clostridia bacterium]
MVDRELIEKIIKQVLSENQATVLSFSPLSETISEQHRLDTGKPADKVYTKDLLSLKESPDLGFGVMEMKETTFDWTLNYAEIDVVLEGTLSVIQNGITKTAHKNEAIFIPKGSKIQFSAPDYAKFLYITYPADWQNVKEGL